MDNTDNQELEEKLAPWGTKLTDTETGHRSSSPLNEKLAQWGTSIDEQNIEVARHSPARENRRSREISPHERRSSDQQKVQHENKQHEDGGPSSSSVDQQYVNEKLSAWGRKVDDQKGGEPMNQQSTSGQDQLFYGLARAESVEFEVFQRKGLEKKLMEWGINTEIVEYTKALTEGEAQLVVSTLEGTFAKNLFFQDKQNQLFLFCTAHDTSITFKDLAKLSGASGQLRLASAHLILEKLGLQEGVATIFGLINDHLHDVKPVLDKRFFDGTFSKIHFHPMVRSALTAISPDGLKKFLEHTGHQPVMVDVAREPL